MKKYLLSCRSDLGLPLLSLTANSQSFRLLKV
jgi:hypothetical protein